MKEINVSNMNVNTAYRFDINKYVCTTIVMESRNGTKKFSEPVKCTSVYELTDEGYLKPLASGELIPNKEVPSYIEGFSIRDFDTNEISNYKAPMYLQEISFDDLNDLKEFVSISHRKK